MGFAYGINMIMLLSNKVLHFFINKTSLEERREEERASSFVVSIPSSNCMSTMLTVITKRKTSYIHHHAYIIIESISKCRSINRYRDKHLLIMVSLCYI